jgi:ATP-dependent exoDNAse (exonuclease V) alpha subunit
LISSVLGSSSYYRVVAPTGRAAHNVYGITHQSLLSIVPSDDDAFIPDLKTGLALNDLQTRLKDLEYLFIDEISMVGCKMFHLIDRRLRQAKCRPHDLFGGVNVIVVGDMKQLPPVFDTSLTAGRNLRTYSDCVLAGMFAFDQIENVLILTIIVRQGDAAQERFRDLLNRLRMGESNEDDYNLLMTRVYANQPDDVKLDFESATRLAPFKLMVSHYNTDKLSTLAIGVNPEFICRVEASHTPTNKLLTARQMSSDRMMGLESSLYLARGARVMISQNVWVSKGLTNGATGTIRYVIFEKDVCPPNLPIALVVEMDSNYNGPCIEGLPLHIALNPITSHCDTLEGRLERTQLPIRIAYSITIHKSQGKCSF